LRVDEQDYVRDMSVGEIRKYIKALLSAVAHVHHCKIIHRDIKHSNFLYNRRLKQLSRYDYDFNTFTLFYMFFK